MMHTCIPCLDDNVDMTMAIVGAVVVFAVMAVVTVVVVIQRTHERRHQRALDLEIRRELFHNPERYY